MSYPLITMLQIRLLLHLLEKGTSQRKQPGSWALVATRSIIKQPGPMDPVWTLMPNFHFQILPFLRCYIQPSLKKKQILGWNTCQPGVKVISRSCAKPELPNIFYGRNTARKLLMAMRILSCEDLKSYERKNGATMHFTHRPGEFLQICFAMPQGRAKGQRHGY